MNDSTKEASTSNGEQNVNEEQHYQNNSNMDMEARQYFLLPDTRSREYYREYIPRAGVHRYQPALRNLIPIRHEKVDRESMPSDSAGLFSYVFITWMTRYLWKAYKSGITLRDLPRISPYESAGYNVQRLELLWQRELSEHGPTDASLRTVAWKFVRTRVLTACFFLTCSIIFGFISPAILMRNILEHIQSPDGTVWDGAKWAILLIMSDLLRTIFFAWTWLTNYRTAIRLKTACTSMLYKKLIRLNSLGNTSTGEIINLFSNDSQRLFDVAIYAPMIISGPIAITLGIVYILWIFNPIALLGLAVFVLFYPCQYLISRATGYFRKKAVKVADARVRLMTEILECIKLIKTYAWENYFSKTLLDIRKREERFLHKTAYFQSLSISLTPAVPVISTIVTFLAHVSSGSNLTAAQAFPITTIFWTLIRMALASLKDSTRYFVDAIVAFRRFKVFPLVSLLNAQIRSYFMFLQVGFVTLAESKITIHRLQRVLLLDETSCHVSKPIVKSEAIAVSNGTFVCINSEVQKESTKHSSNKKKERELMHNKNNSELERLNKLSQESKYIEVLTDISFRASKGQLIGICGCVGSGKSTLLLAILGQLRATKGQVTRDGTCAYVSQQTWIVNTTLKENILFGEQFNAKRYYQALTMCSLKEDLNMLPAGDETEIGERGINLSGGQKQRVALARALYANRDIYFLDDPLSAVDAHVGAYIFENLILNALKNKTVLFVTHQVQFLKHCNHIYMMNSGKIAEHGNHEELMQMDNEYASMVNSTILGAENHQSDRRESVQAASTDVSNSTSSDPTVQSLNSILKDKHEGGEKSDKIQTGGTLMVQDKVEIGTIKMHTYHAYIKAAGGYFIVALVFLAFFLNIGSSAFSSWWLATWINAGGGNITVPGSNETVISENLNDNPDFSYYQTVYTACIGAILITSILRGLAITFTTIKASTSLHNKLFKKMIRSSLKFFETTPIGRIQNIFSRDIDEVDNYLPISIESIVQNIFTCSFTILFVCSVIPWATIALFILGTIFFLISKVFRVAIRDLRRMESLTRSPVLSFVTTTIHGLHTIHAFRKEKEFLNKFEELFDQNNLCVYLCQAGMRWSALRLDSLAITSTCVTAFLIIFLKGQIPPALAGLALAYCTQMSGAFQYTVRVMAETEMRFISVERINYYLKTLDEEGSKGKAVITPPEDWPSNGKVEFKKVQMRYRNDLPLVLINISFVAKPGEKLGIIGRTGSGKSSLVTALFRLVELSSGIIKIDDIDVSKISLTLLRSKLSIIPQDPVLFSGSIRSNLDPFKEHVDADIWDALEKTQLKDKVKIMSGQLNASVGFGGNNLSVGERQLLCLTRALLRCSKVLILDEATAAVDPETEAAVQNTIQNVFAKCTVLTIAHRLKTVVSCDRVLVMSNGQIIENGPPNILLSNPDSEFSKMLAVAEK